MRFFRPVAAAAFAVLLAGPVAAQTGLTPDPERMKLSGDLIELMNVRPTMQQLSAGTIASITKAYTAQQKGKITDANKKAISEAVRTNMAKKLPELITVLAPAAAQVFTAEELKAFVDFLKTPIGKQIMAKMPGYQVAQSRLAAGWLQKNTPVIEKQILADLAAKGVKVARPGSAPQPAAKAD